MVTWFAGLFYLPRLYVYHAQAQDQLSKDRFKIMERKLFWGIMTPGGIFTILFGVMLFQYHGMPFWLQMKLLLVLFLVIYHVWCGVLLKKFKTDSNTHSHVWYRVFNEIPVLFLVAIVILVIYKPI
tara:strand:- start:2944 stop:3321 length:378 start_codon:yes stop_codon:yes gene_type:complete